MIEQVSEQNIDSLVSDIHSVDPVSGSTIAAFLKTDALSYAKDLAYFDQRLQGDKVESNYDIRKIGDLSDRVTRIGYELEIKLTHPKAVKQLKAFFRQIVGNWVYKSEIMSHAYNKPRGYPGDFQLIEKIYDNQPLSKGLGFCFDRCFLDNPYAIAVRNRKDIMKRLLQETWRQSTEGSFQILNLGCGSCREVKEALEEVRPSIPTRFIGVDQDVAALEFARKTLLAVAPKSFTCDMKKADIVRMRSHALPPPSSIDVVYSIGFADYFPNRILKNMLSAAFALVKPGGRLIIAHKDTKACNPILHDWLCDWNFVSRSIDELIKLAREACGNRVPIALQKEPSGLIFFLTLTK